MPKQRRKIPTPSWERDRGALGQQLLGHTPQFYGAIAIVLLVVAALGLVGFGFLSDYIAKQNRPGSTAVQIGETSYSVEYFTNRLKMYVKQLGGSGAQTAQPSTAIPAIVSQIVAENAVLNNASEKQASATDDDVNTQIASQLGIKATDANFQSRLQEELTRNGLTETQYRDFIKARVLQTKLNDAFSAALPATIESVHYRQIQVDSLATADALRAQIEGGADFAALAKEKSSDAATKDQGGDAGWVPRGLLDKATEDTLFGLSANQLTTYPTQSGAFVYQVLEKQADHPIDDSSKPALASKAFQDWLRSKTSGLTVVNNMDFTSGDGDKINYAVKHAYAA